MNIATLSTALAQNSVQQTAATQVQKMAMDSTKAQGASLVHMMSEIITDPALGNKVDVFA